jgi:RNA polymerase primary sigma factor
MKENWGGRPPYDADARQHDERVSRPVSNRLRNRDYYRVGNVPEFRELKAEVAEKKAAGDETARREFAEGNLRLVLAIARGYQRFGEAFRELVSAGNEALMLAVSRTWKI